MTIEFQPDRNRSKKLGLHLPVALILIMIVLVITGSVIYVFKRLTELPGRGADKVAQTLMSVAEAFHKGTVSTSFISYATTVAGTSYFQFATLDQMEVFERKDERTAFWVPLPEVIVEARASVEYTYYLDFKGDWKLTIKDRTIRVLTPPIQFNTPAVNASKIEYTVRKGSIFRREAPVMEALKLSITDETRHRAKDNIPLVRDEGRKQTAAFIKTWLGHQYIDGRDCSVEVFFPDEPLPSPSTTIFLKQE